MSILKTKLKAGTFVVTAEVAPPKGVDLQGVMDTARKLSQIRQLSAINVTDNQGANMRQSPLVLAGALSREGIEPVLQLTCRDRNRMALQSELLGAAALGVENVLMLSGDHPRFGDHPQSRAVFDLDSVQLLMAVEELNRGRDLAGCALADAPAFFAGAAAAPEAEPFGLMLQKLRKKVSAGARFVQTQAAFDAQKIERFASAAHELQVPVLLGVLLLKSAAMARFLNAHIPGVQVPANLVECLDASSDPLAEGVAIARDLVEKARDCCQGVHLMTLGREDLIPALLDANH